MSVTFLFILFIQISFLVFIFPSWLSSYYKEKEINLELDSVSQSTLSKNTGSIAGIISGTNVKLNILNTALEYPELTHFVNSIIANKTSSIHLNQFIYTAVSSTTATINLGGISNTRQSLVSFVKSLQGLKIFKIVDLPVSNLAKDKNIDFSINLTI